MSKEKARYFTFLLYPESIPEDWILKLELLDLPIAISPIHDKDISTVEGQKFKKPHYHVIYVAKNPVTAHSVRMRIKRALGSESVAMVQIIKSSMENMYLYLTHESKDAIAKNKHIYDKSNIKLLNNFDIDRYVVLDVEEKEEMFNLVCELIDDHDLANIRELRRSRDLNYRFIQPLEDDYQEIDDYNNLVLNHEPFNDNYYVNGRQYQVICSDVISPEENRKKINFSLKFETAEIPFAESIGTSLDLEKRPDKELWSNDMNIPFDENDSLRTYTFNGLYNSAVYYHGNVANNQSNLYKKVTIVLGTDIKATDSFVFSLGTSDIMTIKGINLKKNDKIVYDGTQTYRNGVPINNESSGAQPKFVPGWNEFEFNHFVKLVQFDMKFYYL